MIGALHTVAGETACEVSVFTDDLTIVHAGQSLIGAVRAIDDCGRVVGSGMINVFADEAHGAISEQELSASGMQTVKCAVQSGAGNERTIDFVSGGADMIMGTVITVCVVTALRAAAGCDIAIDVLAGRADGIAGWVGEVWDIAHFTRHNHVGSPVSHVTK